MGIFNFSNEDDLLSQIAGGFFGTDYQKDYQHASKLMRPNGLALAPKQKFLFHVFFTLTDPAKHGPEDRGLIGALVKSVQLPSFTLDTEEYVQYNRKRLVHNKIKYEPITIKLHDDNDDNVRRLWAEYYQYYFADSSYEYDGASNRPDGKTDYNGRDIYNDARVNQNAGWGKTNRTSDSSGAKPAFFKNIKIYGMNRGRWVSYTLINPVITAWRHDTYDYSAGDGIMEHEMQIQYEAVKYGSGTENGNIPGFAEESRYDKAPGALGPGSTTSVFGQGGLADTFEAVIQDLPENPLGAIQKIGASAETFGSIENLSAVVGTDVVNAVLYGTDAASSTTRELNFPSPESALGALIPPVGPRKVE